MNEYITNESFNDLYFDFTGHAHSNYPKHRVSVAQDLTKAIATFSSKEKPGPLIVATATGIYAYDSSEGHRLISGSGFRAQQNSGFYEITSISHVGPAIAYLAAMKKMGSNEWEKHIPTMLEHIRAIKAFNSAPIEDNWLTKLSETAWLGRELLIKNMVEYACSLADSYLVKIRDGKEDFTPDNVVLNFLESKTAQYPIGFNTIMIGTFSLVALKSAYDIYSALGEKEIDWKNAKVILHNQAGTNYSAGLTAGSNWLHPTIKAIAGSKLDESRIIIAPYANIPATVGEAFLPIEDYEFLSDGIWAALYARPRVTEMVFSHINDINIPLRNAIPGDYGYTKADDIDHFLMRLKFSTGNIKEMLSSSVGFWIAGEAAAKSWDLTKIDLPGLTHGLPIGTHAYPTESPASKE
jgi:hypothetical protein